MYSNVVCIGDSYTNEEEMYKRLISEIARDKDFKKKFDKLKVESYEFSESLLGGRQFVLLGKDLRTLFVLTGKELNAIQYQWNGEF